MSETGSFIAEGAAPEIAAPVSTAAALDAAPAAPAVPTSQQLSPPAAVVPAPATPSWLEGADEVTVGYVQNKGWDDPKQVLEGYRNLEKLLGADKANNAIIIPKADADPKEWAAVYDRLGRPTAPDGYKVDLPEGGDKAMHEASLSKFHELGLTKNQGENLLNWYNGVILEHLQNEQVQKQTTFQQEDAALKSEWGAAYNQNLAQAQAGMRGLGLDTETVDKLSEALGHKATMGLLQRVGAGMREDSLVTSDTAGGFSSALTPGQAKAEIQTLMKDRDFVANYVNKKEDAVKRMAVLHSFAYPEG